MAAPTISTISPSSGHPGGGYVLLIEGADFDVPVATAPTELPADAPDDTVTVTVNGRTATEVEVWSSSLISCRCPSFRGDPADLSADPGVDVDVVVTNIGPPAESTTVDDGFTYQRTDFTDDETTLVHVIRHLVLELRRQVLLNTVITTHPDYDGSPSDGLDIVELAEVPGIALFGPRLLADPDRQMRGYQDTQDLVSLEYEEHKSRVARKLVFDVTMVGETPIEVLQIEQEFEAFFQRNGTLAVPSDPSDTGSDLVNLPIFLTGPPDRTGAANSSGTVSSAAQFEVHGVALDAADRVRVRWGVILDDPADLRPRGLDLETET